MTINYYTKSVYGKDNIYLANAESRNLWYRITGQKTISELQMDNLRDLTGVTFTRVFEAEA